MGKSKTGAGKLTTAEVRERVLQLRLSGASYREIGAVVGVNASTAYRHVRKAIAAIEKRCAEQAAEIRRLELERLDALQMALWPRALNGDEKATRQVLRVMERRAALLGLDEAAETERTVAEVLATLLASRRAELLGEGDEEPAGEDDDGGGSESAG